MSLPQSPDRARARSGPRFVFTVAGLGVILSVGNALLLAEHQPFVRLRELAPLWFARRVFETVGVNLMTLLPRFIHRPFQSEDSAGLLAWLAASAWFGLFCAFGLFAFATGVVLVLRPLLARHSMRWRLAAPAKLVRLSPMAASSLAVLATMLLLGLSVGAIIASRSARHSSIARATASPDQPNIVLISIDSLRRDHLGCYGYREDTSPVLDALAADGARFETVVAPTTWTLPSHLTLLTALPPERHGVVLHDQRLGADVVTLTQVLWKAGYATAGFVSAPFLDASYGFGRGFDLYDDYTIARATNPHAHQAVTSPSLHAATAAWLAQWNVAGRQRPFFLFLHMWDPHLEYQPPAPYDTMFSPDVKRAQRLLEGKNAPRTPEQLARAIALYDGEIRFTDMYIGKLVEELRVLGVLDRTVFAVTADHGDEFYEHGREGHRKNLYDETLLVPLIVRYTPRVPRGVQVEAQVRLQDVAPTLLELAGVSATELDLVGESPSNHGSRSLVPLLADPTGTHVPAELAFADLNGEQAAVRTLSEKFITMLDGPRRRERYDLLADPGELRNLAVEDTARLRECAAVLAVWRASVSFRAAENPLGAEQKALLRSLGYIR